MEDSELYRQILGLEAPWTVVDVVLDLPGGTVSVFVQREDRSLECPECGVACPRYDSRQRSWRHLDTCQYRTILVAEVPRVQCDEHGVLQVKVPWAEPGSRFTALFEALAIGWMREASLAAVARQLGLSWDEASGIMARAVRRGLRRRDDVKPTVIGVDETSFQKRHEYITVVSDLVEPRVLHVADGRGRESLDEFYGQLGPEALERLESIAMDMWMPYIASTRSKVPEANDKIAFDKYHVAAHLGHAVDLVRRKENRELRASGDTRLVGTRYLWLQNRKNMSRGRRRRFADLRASSLKVARAWAIKETAMNLWSYRTRQGAEKGWRRLLGWASRSRLAPVRQVAAMIRRHFTGVINAVVSGVTNATAEAFNSRIQWVKKMACGYRNRARFREAIYFHLGGLDLMPETLCTHTIP